MQAFEQDSLPDPIQEEKVLKWLLKMGKLTQEQADKVMEIRDTGNSPLWTVLGSLNYIELEDYAIALSEVTRSGFISELIGTENFSYDEEFVRKFDPAYMVRYLFIPLQQFDETVMALAVHPDDPMIKQRIHRIVPNADVVTMVATERDVTRLINDIFRAESSHKAVHFLEENFPQYAASQVFTIPQLIVIAGIFIALVGGAIADFATTATIVIVLITLLYFASILFKLLLAFAAPSDRGRWANKEQAYALSPDELPIYSILVPVYKEPEVVPRLLKALGNMDYPAEKLDVLLLMEEDDLDTIDAAKAAEPPSFFRFILVPESQPRTKPKACNYGLTFCRGEYVTIYDAEDIPEPDQLRKAVAAFRQHDEKLICVQSALNYFNAEENYLTRMFTLEYTYWFDYLLPGLDRLDLVIPLGGTSNHFRLNVLRELGGWDAFNVTEDAELGVRASVTGHRTGIIESTTYEEANKETINWIRQRSRWIKGYMITWLVYNRNPLKLLSQLGLKRWFGFQLFVGGTSLIFLLNPIMWGLFVLWIVIQPEWIDRLFNNWVWLLAALSLLFGNLMAIGLNALASLRRKQWRLFIFALTNPLYWSLHSVASYMALWQLVTNPFYWEKTNHGLTDVNPDFLLTKAGDNAKKSE